MLGIMAGWTNPLPIGRSTRTTTPSVSCVSEVNGKRFSREHVKLGVIAPPAGPVGYPQYINPELSPTRHSPATRDLPYRKIQKFLYHTRFSFPTHHPSVNWKRPPRQPGYIGFNHPVQLGQRPLHQCLPQWNHIMRPGREGCSPGSHLSGYFGV